MSYRNAQWIRVLTIDGSKPVVGLEMSYGTHARQIDTRLPFRARVTNAAMHVPNKTVSETAASKRGRTVLRIEKEFATSSE